MATYQELYDLRTNSDLRNKVAVAVIVKAQSLLDAATPTADEVTWANDAITNPVGKANQLLNYVLAVNKASTPANITGATDSAIQTNVDSAVDAIITGGA